MLRRLRGPAFLILAGVTALLNQWGILGFARSWPLYLILAGILGLVARAVLSASPQPSYPVYPSPGYGPPPGYGPGFAPVYGAPAAGPLPPAGGQTAVPGADPLLNPDRRQ